VLLAPPSNSCHLYGHTHFCPYPCVLELYTPTVGSAARRNAEEEVLHSNLKQ